MLPVIRVIILLLYNKDGNWIELPAVVLDKPMLFYCSCSFLFPKAQWTLESPYLIIEEKGKA